jgi:protease I
MRRWFSMVLVCLLLIACGGSPGPTPDLLATSAAVEQVAQSATTAAVPTWTGTPQTTPPLAPSPTLTDRAMPTRTATTSPSPTLTTATTPPAWPTAARIATSMPAPSQTQAPLLPGERTNTVLFVFGRQVIYPAYEATRSVFTDAGYKVVVASDTLHPIQGVDMSYTSGWDYSAFSDLRVTADILLEDVRVDEYDAVVFLPDYWFSWGAGRPETDRIARQTVRQGKVLGAFYVALTTIALADVLRGVHVARAHEHWCRQDWLENSGAICSSGDVAREGLIVTASTRFKGPILAEAILDVLSGP